MAEPLLRKVDCLQLRVPSIEAGLEFYAAMLGHELIWRTETQAALRLPDCDTELVIQTERAEPEVDLLVDSIDDAVRRIESAGGSVVSQAIEIPVGRLAVVADPFGNALVLIELSKGRFVTDADKNVTAVAP
jgi:predicted enzyme related to lactoylglutathione lyase